MTDGSAILRALTVTPATAVTLHVIQTTWSVARNMAQEYLSSMFFEGLSGAGALRDLRDMGMGYRTQDFYEDWRNITGYEKGKAAILRLESNELIPENLWGSEYQRSPTRFRYSITNSVLDPETGEIDLQHRSIYSDKYLSVGELEEEGMANSEGYLRGYPLVTLETRVVGVWERGR